MYEARVKKKAHVAALRQKAYELGLSGTPVLSMHLADLAKHYNGCGPEFFPAAMREKLTTYLAVFEPAFLIHDLRFVLGDGSTATFNAANAELHFNLCRIAKATYPWYNWRRYRALAAADIITGACDRFGLEAYIAAAKTAVLALVALAFTGCYRSIELVREGEYTLTYTAVGLKTDVSKIEAEKSTNGTVRVFIEGVATDVSERNAKIIESSGTAVGNVAKEVVKGMK